MQSMTDYEHWRDSLHDSPRPDDGPDERSIRYFTHDYTADTRLEFTRTGQRSELTLSFSSEDPDMGTEEMIYAGENGESIWACNERTRRGDIVVLYCTSPRSYIHSIWRSNSGGIFNPFDYYHCRTTVCDGILTPHITFKDLKDDEYMSQVPIVRRNLQGINGIELTA